MLIRRCFCIWILKEFLLVNEVGRVYYHMWEERIDIGLNYLVVISAKIFSTLFSMHNFWFNESVYKWRHSIFVLFFTLGTLISLCELHVSNLAVRNTILDDLLKVLCFNHSSSDAPPPIFLNSFWKFKRAKLQNIRPRHVIVTSLNDHRMLFARIG